MWDRMTICTECGTDLRGPEIPVEYRHEYGARTHFSRLVGISDGNRVVGFRCPDCAAEFRMGRSLEPVAVRDVVET